jgi:multidrug efflux system outer membrane protein
MRSLVFSAPVAALLLSGCSMAPTYIRPAAPVPAEWPSGAAYPAAEAGAESGLPWQSLIENAKLRRVITQMLENNRDLRVSLANVAAARAQYRSQRSSIFPTVSATVADNATGGPRGGIDNYTANVGISAFEIDLFGRLRNQASAQFEAYLATQSGMRATKLSLV